VAVRFTEKVPLAVGVPEMFPEDALMLNPPGSPEAVQVTGEFPPEAATVVLYARPIAPLGKELLLIARAGAMVSERWLVAVSGVVLESVTVMATVTVPLAVGIPLIVPLDWPIVKPLGNPLALQEIGELPPVDVRVVL